jgi:ubiquitin C-terminal hydrolase
LLTCTHQQPNLMSESKGIVGLTNIGNTCYGNATLQALRHQVDLTIFLLQDQHKELLQRKQANEKTHLLTNYAQLIRRLWTAESGTESTKEFWGAMIPAAIQAGFEQFRIPAPHDAHEFLCFLLDQFHEAMSDEVTMTVRTPSEQTDTHEALEAWKHSFEAHYSPLVEIVFGLQRRGMKCSSCNHTFNKWETFNSLKTTVPKQSDPVDLLQLLQQDSCGEKIEDYRCDACKEKITLEVDTKLWRLGSWVVIVLKRFDNRGHRINTLVKIPHEIEFSSLFVPSSQEPSAKDTYELFSTIHHHGSAGGGHYTAHAKHPVLGKWAYYDDESARPIEGLPHLDPSTYIVMYRRQTH